MSELEAVRKLAASAIELERAGDEAGEDAALAALDAIGATSADVDVLSEIANFHADHDQDGGIAGLSSEYASERSTARLLRALSAVSPVTATASVRVQWRAAIAAEALQEAAVDCQSLPQIVAGEPVPLLNLAIS
jgi:hypothetical protein